MVINAKMFTRALYKTATILEHYQKQPSRGVLRKRCSENMQQVCSRAPMPKCEKVHGCSPVNLLHLFRTPLLKNTIEGLLLHYDFVLLSKHILIIWKVTVEDVYGPWCLCKIYVWCLCKSWRCLWSLCISGTSLILIKTE